MRILAGIRVLVAALLLSVAGAGACAAMAQAAAACKAAPTPAAHSATAGQTISEKIAADRNKLDINTATAAQLKTLPGVGDVYAARIIAGRPYTMKTQLASRGVLSRAVYTGISAKIVAHRPKK